MSRYQGRLSRIVFAVAFAGLGIWSLIKAEYGLGAIFIVFSVAWLLLAIYSDKLAELWGR